MQWRNTLMALVVLALCSPALPLTAQTTVVTIQAEGMKLASYRVDDADNNFIRLKSASGSASKTFNGPTGTYNMDIHVLLEHDGQSSLEVYKSDVRLLTYKYPLGTTAATFRINNVGLTSGENIKLVGRADGDAWARVDKIVLTPVVASTTYSGTPYSGAPVELPKAFEAANFDNGGQGIAYRDLTTGNAGGLYRTAEDVDIIASADSLAGPYTVNNFQTGEWLAYTVNVPADGNYDVAIRASSNQTTPATFRIEVDGVDVTGSIAVPKTVNWTTFQWVGKQTVPLTAGTRVLKIVSEQEYFNINAVSVLASVAPTPVPSPSGTVQFSCSFENSPIECGFVEQAKEAGRATLAEVARDGIRGVRLHTEPGDTDVSGSGTRERNDLRLSQSASDCYEGRTHWWAHSILFPDDFILPESGLAFDFHHTGSSGQANFQIRINSQGLSFEYGGGATVQTSLSSPGRYTAPIGALVKNQWYDFVYNVKWSSGSDGFMYSWVNGVQKIAYQGPTLYAGQGCYLKLANYHTPTAASSIVHDRVIRGSSAAAVALTPLQGVQ